MESNHRLYVLTGRLFNLSIIAFGVFAAVTFGALFLKAYSMAEMMAWWAIGAVAIAGPAGLARVLMTLFSSAQIHLQELLFTLLAAAMVASPLANHIRLTETDSEILIERVIGLPMTIIALFFLGSAWAWYAGSLLRESRPRKRMLLLVKGWLLCAGAVGALGVMISLVFFAVERQLSRDVATTLFVCAPLTLLMIPAFMVELQCRKHAVAARAAAKPHTAQNPAK